MTLHTLIFTNTQALSHQICFSISKINRHQKIVYVDVIAHDDVVDVIVKQVYKSKLTYLMYMSTGEIDINILKQLDKSPKCYVVLQYARP